MAEIMEIGESHYRKIETNHNGITTEKLLLVSAFFELKMEALLNTDEHDFRNSIRDKGKEYDIRMADKIKSLPKR